MNKTRPIIWTISALVAFLFALIFSSGHANALTPRAEMPAFSLQETLQVTNMTIPCPMNLPEGEVDGETVVWGAIPNSRSEAKLTEMERKSRL